MLDLLENRVSPGVDDAAYVKAAFLNEVASEEHHVAAISPEEAVRMLGMMLGGYNVKPLVNSLASKNEKVVESTYFMGKCRVVLK